MKLDRTLIERSSLTERQKKLLVLIDVEGHGVVETAKLLGKGKSTVSIGHARALKKFSEWLGEEDTASGKEEGAGVEMLKGIHYAEKLDALGVALDKLPSFVALVEKYGPRAGEVLEYAVKLMELEEKEGKSYQAVLVDFAEKAQGAKELGTETERLKKEKRSLEGSLGELHTLVPLKEELDKHNLSGHRLQAFIDRNLRLDELGFSSQAAEVLGSELQKKGLDPSKAAVILSSMIDDYRTAEEAVADMSRQKGDLQKQLRTTLRKVEMVEEELRGVDDLVRVKKGQLEGLKQLEADQERLHRSTMERREHEGSVQAGELVKEIASLEGRKKVLQEGVSQLKDEERRTQSALLELEGNLQKIEGQVGKTKPLAVVASVTENPKSPLPPSDVVKTLLGVIAGFKSYSDANPRDLTPETRRILGELLSILGKEARIAGRQAQ